jgi:hypothetical protein
MSDPGSPHHESRATAAQPASETPAAANNGVAPPAPDQTPTATGDKPQQQLEEQQGAGAELAAAASGFADDARQALSRLGDQLDEIQDSADATQEDAQAAIDRAKAAGAHAPGYLGADSGAFDAASVSAEQAPSEIQVRSESWSETLGS